MNAIQFVHGVCGTNTRAYLVKVSDQRGTGLVEKPAKGGLCLKQPLNLIIMALVYNKAYILLLYVVYTLKEHPKTDIAELGRAESSSSERCGESCWITNVT